MKRSLYIIGIIVLVLFTSGAGQAQYRVTKVVIDAGHGGKDPGAVGKKSREKDIALAIALKTGEYISKYLPEVEVIYTRTDDSFVELHKRADIANKSQADLFISIHCNANRSPAPFGTETYVMGLHKSEENLEVAKLENAAILKEENYADMYQGFNPNEDEDYIALTLFQDAFLDQSLSFADQMQVQFRERVKLKDRGVRQAGFLVLHQTAMPGVLIETGFLSNGKDESFLISEEGQVYIASAIYRAFKEYKTQMERLDNKAKPVTAYTTGHRQSQIIVYRVQFMSQKKERPVDHRKFDGLTDVWEYYHDGSYKYTSGKFLTLEDAVTHQNNLRKQLKFKDAFIVAFLGENRISLDEAKKKTEK